MIFCPYVSAIAQAVNYWLLAMETGVQFLGCLCGICGQSGRFLLRTSAFPCLSSFHQCSILMSSSTLSWVDTIDLFEADMPRDSVSSYSYLHCYLSLYAE